MRCLGVAIALGIVCCCAGLVTEIPLQRIKTPVPISRLRGAYRQPKNRLSKAYNTDPVNLDGTLGLFVANITLGTPRTIRKSTC